MGFKGNHQFLIVTLTHGLELVGIAVFEWPYQFAIIFVLRARGAEENQVFGLSRSVIGKAVMDAHRHISDRAR